MEHQNEPLDYRFPFLNPSKITHLNNSKTARLTIRKRNCGRNSMTAKIGDPAYNVL